MVPPADHHDTLPRVLVVHDDPDLVQSMLGALGRTCCDALPVELLQQADKGIVCRRALANADPWRGASCEGQERVTEHCAHGFAMPCVTVLSTLRQLHHHDLSTCDIVICASMLRDGSGMDALAYVRGIRSDLPVVISGDPFDASLAVEAIRAGAADFLVTTGGDLHMLPLVIEKCLTHQRIRQENEHLQSDLSRSLSETAVKNRQLQALIHQLETMARTDDLTGLCNRRWLNIMLERSWSESQRCDHPVAFMMIDIDGFKVVNDVLGHQTGDEMLRMTGRVLDANCRQIDFPARYGGDEFCVLLPNTELSEAAVVTHRIHKAYLTALRGFLQNGLEVGMSIGLSHVNLSEPISADQLITHADEAMYAAKAAGRNSAMVHGKDCMTPLEQFLTMYFPEPRDPVDQFRDAG